MFRIIFGAMLLFSSVRFIAKGWVNTQYIEPQFYFGYLGFEWIKPLPGNLMYIPFVLMVLAALFILLGFMYRYSAFVFFICFTYVELIDKSNYLNHYYFLSLMSFLMVLVPANRDFSIDAKLFPKIRREVTYAWHTGILKFQLAVVYIFAGIAKINSDWLFEAQPLKIWLQAHHNVPFVGSLLQEEWTAYFFSWMGCVYDLFIVFFLLNKKTRPIAYLAVIFFHVITWLLFPIGVFPWVMIFSTTIFFGTKFHQQLLNGLKSLFKWSKKIPEKVKNMPSPKPYVRYGLIIYIAFQILVPLRFLAYPGNLYWNEEGFRFSWRVMLMHKEGNATFYVTDKSTGRTIEVDNTDFLTVRQEDQMATQPDMILQFAKMLKEEYDGKTFSNHKQSITLHDPAVHAEVFVTLNGRSSQLFIDKKHDLTTLPYNLKHREWIVPFEK
ncbi:HTTM domain-containing protein [Brumimicrobium salinarum]|uniref:HTTM domain-containing protein n=2 Tax=Brumimicrobium salinarum TaxID=2058658 RepID=A0A2I0R4K2_9FLAO|nr:HTTM domain-containing protein [Brumimicrobium salinarum]